MRIARYMKAGLLTLAAVAVVAILLFLKADPFLFNKSPGSYEYIRMGERLIEKKDIEGAVPFFEKAYASSPDNDSIRANLIWIYTIYAADLSENGKENRSIYFLKKAYDLKKNSATSQNLAIAYAKKGLSDIRKGDRLKAAEAFGVARDVASSSGRTSENLGIFLYNAAVKLMGEGKADGAMLLLNESILANESKYPIKFLGDIFYRKNDLEDAVFYWKRASELDSENKELADKIERVVKEIEALKSQEVVASGHFELRYDKKLVFDALAAEAALEKAYYKVGARLKFFPKEKTTVFLYSEADFRDIFKLSPLVRAFYDGNIRMPLPERPVEGEGLTQFIDHEYTHAVLSAMTDNRTPPWLGEGIAVWLQIKDDDPVIRQSLVKFGDLSGVTIDSIDRAFRDSAIAKEKIGLYYILSYTVVEYIDKVFGQRRLRGILERIKKGAHFANAMDDELLISEKELERRWREWTMKKWRQ